MKIKLDHINLTVQDIKESIQWYERIFGFKIVERGIGTRGQPWAIVASNDSMIVMSEFKLELNTNHQQGMDSHKIYHFGIRISDSEVWEKKVKDNNLSLYYGGVIQYPFSRSWYVHDPSGHEIEVSHTQFESMRFPNGGAV